MTELRTETDATGLRFVLVAARWNEPAVRRMVDAALDTLRRQGAAEEALALWWVPGSYELPLAAQWAARGATCDAVLAFGVVLQGETEHFRLVSEAASAGLQQVAIAASVPVLNGVLAAHDEAQVVARTGGAMGNIGSQNALAAIAMARLRRAVGPR